MKPDFSFVINAQSYLRDCTDASCFLLCFVTKSYSFPSYAVVLHRLLDCIQHVTVKGTLASRDIIFLGWTGRQKDKSTLWKYMVVAK